ncbi:MAG: molybdenum cofactor guanylyltransferase [Pirellulaceae bacterium]|nr:molybdenum cofactor guanylyltransferase [Pirellulaceae bacterium]
MDSTGTLPKTPDLKRGQRSVGGVILCGGKSHRMGTSKALLPFGDEVMLQRVVRILQSALDPVVVVAAEDQPLPELPSDVTVLIDSYPEKGPLAGLFCGLQHLHSLQVPLAFASACDTPFLLPGFIDYLLSKMTDQDEILLLQEGEFQHVLSAFYRTDVYRTAEKLIMSDRLRPIFLTAEHLTHQLNVDQMRAVDPDLVSLQNLNTPSDYEKALQRMRTSQE